MRDGLNGQVALVTGASRGIGRAIAMELACRGAAVAVNYRAKQAEAEDVARRICEMGRPCILVQGNVALPSEARAVVQRVLDEWGRLDILVNNAGITRDRSLRKLADDDWADVINVNLNGTYYCTSAAVPSMVEQQHGHVINISSYVGQAGNFGQANYAASKGGIIAFTKTLALEMAKHGITANAVAPGFTETEMVGAIPQHIQDQIKSKIPLGRFGRPEEVAGVVAFLAADGDYITGQQININGGIYM
jgi:3-oxoacyl-(acyl-carrier-protein) reductase